jgi:hypothetical protein
MIRKMTCQCSQLLAPSHGENRGSSPLGSANKIKAFTQGGGPRPPLKPPFHEGHITPWEFFGPRKKVWPAV